LGNADSRTNGFARNSLTSMTFIAPAGTPIPFFRTTAAMLRSALGNGTHAALRHELAQLAERRESWLYCTGRAAMVVGMQAIRDVAPSPERREVIIPAYTCYSVPAAVSLAGLVPRLCDVLPSTLSYDLAALRRMDTSRAVAIVSANLYGLPNDLSALEAFAIERKLWMFDDAAQAMGATIDGRPVGGFGDMGLFSFDKGKNITSMEGGALLASDPELRSAIAVRNASIPSASGPHAVKTAAKLLAYSLLLHPSLYGAATRLPLGLGRTPYEEHFQIAQYSRLLAGAPHLLFPRLDKLRHGREENARRILRALASSRQVLAPQLLPGAAAAWTRLPVFVTDPGIRSRLIKALVEAGIGATASYPCALNRVPQVAALLPAADLQQPGAEQVAETIVTLPTHAYVPGDVGIRIRAVLNQI
jgi:perosamine synthetase